ncbi:MAG: hypothetical protein Q9159_002230 [Coniocarpon cinnabarinum]
MTNRARSCRSGGSPRRSTRLTRHQATTESSSSHKSSTAGLTKITKTSCLEQPKRQRKPTGQVPQRSNFSNVKRRQDGHGSAAFFDTYLSPPSNPTKGVGYTFGLELELLIICPVDDLRSRLPEELKNLSINGIRRRLHEPTEFGGREHIIREMVQESLRSANLKVNSARSNNESIQEWSVEPEPAIITGNERDQYPDCVVVGIEVKSGALDFTAASLATVVTGIQAIKSDFPVAVNESCGLHVHVGMTEESSGLQQKFDLQTCQGLMVLHLLFEDEINRLHPGHVLTGHEWPQLFRARLQQTLSGDAVAAARAVLEIRSWKDFFGIISNIDHDRNIVVNFQNLKFQDTIQTIEFRQHEGSMDIEQVLRRIQLCIMLTHWSKEVKKAELMNYAWAVENNFSLDILQLLRNVGMPAETVAFYGNRLFDHGMSEESSKGSRNVKKDTPMPDVQRQPKPAKPKRAGSTNMAATNKTWGKALRVLGAGLKLDMASGQSTILFKIGDEVGGNMQPMWVEEDDALEMTKISARALSAIQSVRARRWAGTGKEIVVKRWPWTQ